jgi:hypothetical protein
MKEDHATFEPELESATSEAQSSFARALLLISCQVCFEVSKTQRAQLSDIEDTANSLLLSNWQCDELIDPRILPDRSMPGFLVASRIELAAHVIAASKFQPLHNPNIERLSIMIMKQVAAAFTEDFSVAPPVVQALRASLNLLSQDCMGAIGESTTILKPIVGLFVDEFTRGIESETSGMLANTQVKGNRDQMLQFKVRQKYDSLECKFIVTDLEPYTDTCFGGISSRNAACKGSPTDTT